MQPRFQAALFDVDGTLVDSTAFVLGAMQHALQAHGLAPRPWAELARIMGPPLDECYRQVAPGLDPAALCATHRAWQQDKLHLVHPYPGALAALGQLRAAGVKLAAVTARSRVSSLGTLDGAGIAPFLEFTISAEDAPRGKPHPDPVQLALARLHVSAAAAVMVGDTRADIAAGHAAGVVTIGALYGFTGTALAEAGADHLIRDVGEVVPIVLGPGRAG